MRHIKNTTGTLKTSSSTMVTKENLVELFDDAGKKANQTLHQIHINPIKIQGNTHLKAIELLANQIKVLLVNITKESETSGEVWVDYTCLAPDLFSSAFYKIKGQIDNAQNGVLIETEYREHGNYALINNNMLFLNPYKREFIKAVTALRTAFDKVKVKSHFLNFASTKTQKFEAAAAPCY